MLVSFVVSTATGIMTVAMLEEAPKTLTQTVNRVVERTIERVVTGTSTPEKQIVPVTTVTKEVTIYAKEDDLIVSAVEKNQSRIAKIYASGTATSTAPDAIGFIISRDGMIATDAKTLSAAPSDKSVYTVVIAEKEYVGTFVQKDEYADSPVAFIRLTLRSEDVLDAVSFGSEATQPKVAQTALILGGENGVGIFKATLSKLVYTKSASTSTPPYVSSIETSPRIPTGYEGSLAVNLDGQVVGIVVSGAEGKPLGVYPAMRILNLMTVVTKDKDAKSLSGEESTAAAANAR